MWSSCGGVTVSAGPYSETTLQHFHSIDSEEVSGLFGAIIRTAGASAAARLRGGWERARPRQTQ